MKRLKTQNERKSLECRAFLYINNNSSFHHKSTRIPAHTRARTTPCDVLQYCGIYFWPVLVSQLRYVSLALCEARIRVVSRLNCVMRLFAYRYVLCAVWAFWCVWRRVPNWHSKRSWA